MNYKIRKIAPEYDAQIGKIIKQVGAEFGAIGEGYGPSDLEVNAMSQHYNDSSASCYFVAIISGKVVGGSGIAGFNGSDQTCELKKLFLLPEARGMGLGQKLTETCLDYAQSKDYKQCYLDTLHNMHAAIALYQKLGFTHLSSPLEGTIHNGCDVWMLKQFDD